MKSFTEVDLISRRLAAVFLVSAVVFLAFIAWTPYPFSWLLKTLPIACLCLFSLRNFKGAAARFMGLGFGFSALGDIFLELPRTDLLFMAGMGAFILAHLCYAAYFVRHPRWRPARGLALGIMAAAGVGLALFLLPRLGAMTLPILVYLAVILFMGVSACLGRDNPWTVVAGAFLFILSDSLIAVNMFAAPVPASDFWIMVTYYSAQALLAAGVWQAGQKRPSGTGRPDAAV